MPNIETFDQELYIFIHNGFELLQWYTHKNVS